MYIYYGHWSIWRTPRIWLLKIYLKANSAQQRNRIIIRWYKVTILNDNDDGLIIIYEYTFVLIASYFVNVIYVSIYYWDMIQNVLANKLRYEN